MNPKCPRSNCLNDAIVDTRYGVLPCEEHQRQDAEIEKPITVEFYNRTKIDRIQRERDTHNADIEQPWLPGREMKPNPNFVKLYPDKAHDYFSDEELNRL